MSSNDGKVEQVASAGTGTPISAEEAQRFIGLTNEERAAIVKLAKLTARLRAACSKARDALDGVDAQRRDATRRAQYSFGPIWEIDERGNKTRQVQIKLSPLEQHGWDTKSEAVIAAALPSIEAVIAEVAEEVAVLRMMNVSLSVPASGVDLAVQALPAHLRSQQTLEQSLSVMDGALRQLWEASSGGD
jgi:hypothetical protein